jgi:hypothetical protein
MSAYRICPTNRLVIERKEDPPDARWCFYRACDSPADAKRSLGVIRGEQPVTQTELWTKGDK